jgi:hypothetical protein
MENVELLCDSHRGQYVPLMFVKHYNPVRSWGCAAQDVAIIASGPDTDWYWETWETILSTAKHVDAHGNTWTLFQDGDLFAVNQKHVFEG